MIENIILHYTITAVAILIYFFIFCDLEYYDYDLS